jgi:hypothetical protein
VAVARCSDVSEVTPLPGAMCHAPGARCQAMEICTYVPASFPGTLPDTQPQTPPPFEPQTPFSQRYLIKMASMTTDSMMTAPHVQLRSVRSSNLKMVAQSTSRKAVKTVASAKSGSAKFKNYKFEAIRESTVRTRCCLFVLKTTVRVCGANTGICVFFLDRARWLTFLFLSRAGVS